LIRRAAAHPALRSAHGEEWRAWIPGFDRWAPTYDDEVRDPWFAYEAAWSFVERSLALGLGDLRGRRIADVGCGTGEYLRRVVALGAVGIGVEPSAGMRAAARRKVPGIAVHDGHLADIPLPDCGVDAAMSTYTVSHLSAAEQPAAMHELLRVVGGAGPIVIVDVASARAGEMPRVRDVLRAAGREDQAEWYERGMGLDVAAWRSRLEASGRRVAVEPLGLLLIGLAGLPSAAGASRAERVGQR
jgi:SAM-dependent methyltransferase